MRSHEFLPDNRRVSATRKVVIATILVATVCQIAAIELGSHACPRASLPPSFPGNRHRPATARRLGAKLQRRRTARLGEQAKGIPWIGAGLDPNCAIQSLPQSSGTCRPGSAGVAFVRRWKFKVRRSTTCAYGSWKAAKSHRWMRSETMNRPPTRRLADLPTCRLAVLATRWLIAVRILLRWGHPASGVRRRT